MEYSLLKQIVPNRFYLPSGIVTHPTHYPGFDCVNPGIANVAQPYSFFVPSFFQQNANLKIKQIPAEPVIEKNELEGKGNVETDESQSRPEEKSSEKIAVRVENVLDELNEKKRKLLDSAIYESFTHPKKIKTESLSLISRKNQKVDAIKEAKLSSNSLKTNKVLTSKQMKHKFKFE